MILSYFFCLVNLLILHFCIDNNAASYATLILHAKGVIGMMTVSEISRLAHISKRTLQYYDRIGLLCPSARSAAVYRLYSESNLERFQQILLFRELEFLLSEIHRIMNAPGYDRTDALEKQIEILSLKKEHLENLITFARGVQMLGVKNMKSMDSFDSRKIDEYCAREGNLGEHTRNVRVRIACKEPHKGRRGSPKRGIHAFVR